MHELALFRDLMTQIERRARAEGALRVVAVEVTLGALSHLSAHHFREHFAQLSPGTIAEGAELRIRIQENPHDPHAQEVILTSLEFEVEE